MKVIYAKYVLPHRNALNLYWWWMGAETSLGKIVLCSLLRFPSLLLVRQRVSITFLGLVILRLEYTLLACYLLMLERVNTLDIVLKLVAKLVLYQGPRSS